MSLIRKLKHTLHIVRTEVTPPPKPPDTLLGNLLRDVQLGYIFDDSIAFIDMLPPKQLNKMLREYELDRHQPGFDLHAFVQKYFAPDKNSDTYTTNAEHSIEQHIDALWKVLTRQPQASKGSLIGMPYPYIVPGGRYQTFFYWDSYFMMLGLAAGKHWDMVENMVKNFAFMLRKFGYIPNGNRTYYVGRSQPPYFALMVRLLAEGRGKKIYKKYLPYLLKEYAFWTKGRSYLKSGKLAKDHSLRMPGGEFLERYFDSKSSPRPEGYVEDVHTVLAAGKRAPSKIHSDIRAAAESGWDFSSRWLKDNTTLASIHTTDIVPVDLNCLLYLLEQTIALAYRALGRPLRARRFDELAAARAKAIDKYCWNPEKGFYFDYDVASKQQKPLFTLAGVFPLYAGIAAESQAKSVTKILRTRFLKKGGLVTSTIETGQQWDAPNGWPCLQWVAIRGLRKYKHHTLADEIKRRWIATNLKIFKDKRKLVEKYNVVDPAQLAGGGEYVLQDGFGWTNGVLLALLHEDALNWE